MDQLEVSLILPAYNEKERIRTTVSKAKETLEKITNSYEIIIAEDGSTDGTDKIAEELSKKDKKIIHLHSEERQGRGKALNRAFKKSRGNTVAYIDVDLATDMKHLKELINATREDGYDIATGSRYMKESDVKRGIKRKIASIGFNTLTRILLHSRIKDHQCGFKSFDKERLMEIIDNVKDEHWFWDTEILVLAQSKGYRIKEFPVRWRASTTSKVDITKDIIGMGSRIISLWISNLKNKSSRNSRIIGMIIGIGILLSLAGLVGFKEVLNEITNARIEYLIAASIMYWLSYYIRAKRFKELLKGTGEKISLELSSRTVMSSQWANLVLPARMGDLLRAHLLKENKNIDYTKGLASLITERIFDMISITLLGLISIYYITKNTDYTIPEWMTYTTSTISLMFITLSSTIILIAIKPAFIRKISKRIQNRKKHHDIYTQQLLDTIEKLLKNLESTVSSKKSSFIVLLTSLMIWLSETIIAYIVAISMGISIPFEVLFLAVSIGNIVKAIPNTPNAIGTYEGAISGILIISGISASTSFSIALLDHFIKNLTTLAMGTYALSSLNIKKEYLEKNIDLKKITKEEIQKKI